MERILSLQCKGFSNFAHKILHFVSKYSAIKYNKWLHFVTVSTLYSGKQKKEFQQLRTLNVQSFVEINKSYLMF